jgi:hypothetical protein
MSPLGHLFNYIFGIDPSVADSEESSSELRDCTMSQHDPPESRNSQFTARRRAQTRQHEAWVGRSCERRSRLEGNIDKLFDDDLSKVLHYEKDFPMRFFVWGLMVLQLVKLCIVTGAPFIFITGLIYIISWSTVEMMFVNVASSAKLTQYEKQQARSLWSKLTISQLSIWISETSWSEWKKVQKATFGLFWLIMSSAVLIQVGFSFGLWLKFIFTITERNEISHLDPTDLTFNTIFRQSITMGVISDIYTIIAALCSTLIILPFWVLWLQNRAVRLWNKFGLTYAVGRLPVDRPRSLEASLLLLIPDWFALWHFASILAALVGFDYWILWEVRYQCWTTMKPVCYDWLG